MLCNKELLLFFSKITAERKIEKPNDDNSLLMPPVLNPILWTDKPNATLNCQPKFNNNRVQVPSRNMIGVNLNNIERNLKDGSGDSSEENSGESFEKSLSESLENSERNAAVKSGKTIKGRLITSL